MTHLQELPKSTRGNDVRVGHEHEVVQPSEEGRVLESLLDEGVHLLLKRQVDPDADALHPLACLCRPRPFVGGLHQTRSTARDDRSSWRLY